MGTWGSEMYPGEWYWFECGSGFFEVVPCSFIPKVADAIAGIWSSIYAFLATMQMKEWWLASRIVWMTVYLFATLRSTELEWVETIV